MTRKWVSPLMPVGAGFMGVGWLWWGIGFLLHNALTEDSGLLVAAIAGGYYILGFAATYAPRYADWLIARDEARADQEKTP